MKEWHDGNEVQFIGAGVYHPRTRKACYVQPGGVGMTNTINRAELAGIYAALLDGHTHIATDSASSLSQIRKQLLFPELQRNHLHSHLLQPIVRIIENSPNTIHFYKVKAHAGIAGNEFADAIAKHSAQHDEGHDKSFSPVSDDGNPYSNMYWLAERQTKDGPRGKETRLVALSNLKDKLTQLVQAKHRLGRAKTTGYYTYWFRIRDEVNRKATNAFWTSCKFHEHRNVMRYRTGTLFNQKLAKRYGWTTDSSCPLCHEDDSALHILSGCQNTIMRNMITERHNVASRLILQALSRGHYGANIFFTDVGSNSRLTEQGIDITDVANRTLPAWLLPHLSEEERKLSSRPDAILLLPKNTCSTQFTTHNSALRHFTSTDFDSRQWEIHLIEFKYCEDTRPETQQENAEEQHTGLLQRFRSHGYHKVKLHTILTGVMGTIYNKITDKPLRDLGLNFHQNTKLTRKLNQHSVQYATKLIRTRYALHKNVCGSHGGESGATARNPPDPH